MNYARKQWDKKKRNPSGDANRRCLIAKELNDKKYRPRIKPKKVDPRTWELDKELNVED